MFAFHVQPLSDGGVRLCVWRENGEGISLSRANTQSPWRFSNKWKVYGRPNMTSDLSKFLEYISPKELIEILEKEDDK